MKHTNIVICNGWSDDNKGDSAIVEGLIESIKTVTDPKLSIISSFSKDSAHYVESTRHLERKSSLTILPHPVIRRYPERKISKSARIIDIIKSFLLLVSPRIGRIFLNRYQRASLDTIASADIVIGKGGHYLFGTSTIGGIYTLLNNSYVLLLASRLGVKTALSANSVGPFVGPVANFLAKHIFKSINRLQLREQKSVDLVKQYGITKAIETFDTAFFIDQEALEGFRLTNYIVITARQWDFPYDDKDSKDKYSKYIASLVDVAKYMSDIGYNIVIAPQVTGPTKLEDDRILNETLKEKLSEFKIIPYMFDIDLTPGQLKTIYSGAEFLIGTRFHSVILALSSYVPVIAISYHGPKAPGIMKQFGLEEYVHNIDEMNEIDLIKSCKKLIQNRETLHINIKNKMDTIKGKIKKDIGAIIE